MEEKEDTCLSHVRDDRHNDGLELKEDTCQGHLRDDRHIDGVTVLQLPDALADVEHEVGQRLAGRPRVRVLNTASSSTKQCNKPVSAPRALHLVFPAL